MAKISERLPGELMMHLRQASWSLALLLAGCSGESPPFQAGEWKFDIDISAEGQRTFWGGGGQCVNQTEAENLTAAILSQTALGQCTSSDSKFAGGKFEVNAACDGKAAATVMPASRVSLRGSYTPTSFEARVSAQLQGGAPVKTMSGSLSARRMGDCPDLQQGNAS